jgi:hypothetical protein
VPVIPTPVARSGSSAALFSSLSCRLDQGDSAQSVHAHERTGSAITAVRRDLRLRAELNRHTYA